MIFTQSPAVPSDKSSPRYRVWLFTYSDWQPVSCSDLPFEAVALEEAEPRTFSVEEAARYVKTFNRTALQTSADNNSNVWAVAFPITVFYYGEPRRGQRLFEKVF